MIALRWFKSSIKIVKIILFWVVSISLHIWSSLALYYCSFPSHPALRLPTAIFYDLVIICWIVFYRKKLRFLSLNLFAFLIVALWFGTIKPPKDAIYPPELTMASVNSDGNVVTIHNVRNCRYRSKDDFDVRYETRTYNLIDLQTLDIMVNYWGISTIAHTFLSFGFSDGRYLAVSVEIRPEVGEAYDMLQGFFKQYELIYIWADERDLVGLRTNYKKEDVYLYRLTFSPKQVRKMFVSMLQATNSMHEKPQFYNTATHSCTNTLGNHVISQKIAVVPFWERRLRTGDVDRRLYKYGYLGRSLPFSKLRQQANINARAQRAGQAKDFSEKIRTHLKANIP